MTSGFDHLADRCRQALPTKYQKGIQFQAGLLLEVELATIKIRDWQSAFLEAEQVADSHRRNGWVCRLVGSGCSSLVNYVLGLSDVDPVKYRLHHQRFYSTAGNALPRFQFSAAHPEQAESVSRNNPAFVTWRPMAPLERAAWLTACASIHDTVGHDHSTLSQLWERDHCGIFQFEHDGARRLVAVLKPARIRDVATVTALDLIELSRPDIVACYLQGHPDRKAIPKDQRKFLPAPPILFQEQIMTLLRRWSRTPWNDTYEFVKIASRDGLDQSELGKTVQERLEMCGPAEQAMERFQTLASAATYSVCLAHHAANAITSCRAAYLVNHHQDAYMAAVERFSVEESTAV